MIGYVIFRGISTSTERGIPSNICSGKLENVYVSKMPGHKKAAQRFAEYYVKGRHGALHVDEGYSNFDIEITLVLNDADANTRQIVNAWADGTGKLIISDDLTRCYRATVEGEVRWTRMAADEFAETFDPSESYVFGDFVNYDGNFYKFIHNHSGAWSSADVERQYAMINGLFDTARITFNCQPFMYESVESIVEFTQGGTITNPASFESQPLIKVEGEGTCDFRIGETEEYYIILNDVDPNDPVYIDSEAGYVYTAGGTAKEMIGNFPELHLGQNSVVFGQNGLTKLTITPRWRWI